MSKIKAVLLASVAVFAVGAVTASGASAHEWLTLGGAKLAKAEKATTSGKLRLRDSSIPVLEGGGEIIILCDGNFVGLVGAGPPGTDEITEVTNLAGGERNKVKCEVSESTNSICKVATLVILTPVGLPWLTELITVAGTLNDLATTKAASGLGYEVSCNGISNKCTEKLELSRLVKNNAAGAEFEFYNATKVKCTFGEGLLTGSGTIGFLAN